MTKYEIMTKLIGPIIPVGETNEDEQRYKNLVEFCDLVSNCICDLDRVKNYKNRVEFSMKRQGEYVEKFFKECGINDY